MKHLHILGAPGSGVTTLGKALAAELAWQHFDTDDYHWFTNDDLPFRRRRNPDHRRQLLTQDLNASAPWVLSGSLCGWGDVFIPCFDAVVYLWLPAAVRIERIRAREIARYGAERIEPQGDLHLVYEKFLDWAATYDEPGERSRSRLKELEWMHALPCPTLIIEEELPLSQLMEKVLNRFNL